MSLLFVCLLVFPEWVRAESAQIRQVEIVATRDAYILNADLDLELGETLTTALKNGVSLHFLLEFEVIKKRWYWLNESVSSVNIRYRVNYNSITRGYRLSVGNLHQTFSSIDSVVKTMASVRNWPVLEQNELLPDQEYQAALRFRHDVSRLPRPFQVEAIRDRGWALDTDWLHWNLTTGLAP